MNLSRKSYIAMTVKTSAKIRVERKLLISIFEPNPRKVLSQEISHHKQLKLFDF